jgi:hypothetical protein
MTWCIYYDNEKTFRDTDGPWEAAPVDGVVFVVERIGDRAAFHSGCDYYVRFPDDGSIASTGDLSTLLRRRPAFCTDAIKIGRWTSHAVFTRVSARAAAEWR